MRTLLLALAGLVAVGTATVQAQLGHIDPPSMIVMSASQPINVDGKLNDPDWTRHFFYLNFRAGYKPGDNTYGVTSSALVTSGLTGTKGYTDSSSTSVYFLHYGTDLYVGVLSNDKSVCARWGAWEGDGLFTKFRTKDGLHTYEYDLMYQPDTNKAPFRTTGPAGSGAGTSYEFPGTIVNDNSAPDSGYSLEMVIHLDKLGYSANDTVLADITVMDPDFYTKDTTESTQPGIVQFYKSWWGTEWGGTGQPSDFRQLVLADKPMATAYATPDSITLNGKVSEAVWQKADSVIIGPGSRDATGWWYMEWADSLDRYDDPSFTTVKFLHKGTDLYIGYVSNDSSVCQKSDGWEADGPMISFTDVNGSGGFQVSLMYSGDSVGGPAGFYANSKMPTGSGAGVSYEFPGTVTRTDTNGKDHGYSGEILVKLGDLGYSVGDTAQISIVMWDMDHYSPDVTDPHKHVYAKAWWGSEWTDPTFDKYYMYRQVYLSPSMVTAVKRGVESTPRSFALEQNYPNPFNPTTLITYQLPEKHQVTLKVYNILGEEVATLVNVTQDAGTYQVTWNGRNSFNQSVTSGVYLLVLKAGSYSSVRKMMLLK